MIRLLAETDLIFVFKGKMVTRCDSYNPGKCISPHVAVHNYIPVKIHGHTFRFIIILVKVHRHTVRFIIILVKVHRHTVRFIIITGEGTSPHVAVHITKVTVSTGLTNFVPSGNVPSTCTSPIMSATPGRTCRTPEIGNDLRPFKHYLKAPYSSKLDIFI